MASSSNSWMQEYNQALKLTDDIDGMISERSSFPGSGSETKRHESAIRRKITILVTRLDALQSLWSKLPISEKEKNRRRNMLLNLRSRANQMASTMNMSNRENFLGADTKSADSMSRAKGLENKGITDLQRKILKEQDDELQKLEETVISTKHIASAINEEIHLHNRLIDELDQHVDATGSRLQRVQKNLTILDMRTPRGCSCKCMLLSMGVIVLLVVVIFFLIKYL